MHRSMNKPLAAYYARGRSGWRAWWSLLHPPYTLMHLSFIVVGAALAPMVNLRNLIATVAAFSFALGIAAHALDEVAGNPLGTTIPRLQLIAAATISLGLSVAIGIAGVLVSNVHIIWFIPVGAFLVIAYNLEIFGGVFHSDWWFGLAWGAFPVLTANFAQTGSINVIGLLGATYAFAISLTQRTLSTPARQLRRKTDSVEGLISFSNGTTQILDRPALLGPLELALQWLVRTSVCVALTLLLMRLLRGEWIAGF
jgi:hypothetical protein